MPIVISDIKGAIQPSGQCDCNCDCACSLFAVPQNNFDSQVAAEVLTGLRPIRRSAPSNMLNLNGQYTICFSPQHALAVLNQPALSLLSHFNSSRRLNEVPALWCEDWSDEVIQTTVKQMIILGLLVPENYAAPSLIEPSDILAAWIHITDRCNLRCAYCYLPHARLDMSAEIGRAAIDATFRSALAHNYRQVKFKYAGGEAMLRFPFIVELHHYACKQADKHRLSLNGVILSNGTLLTKEIVRNMRALNLRLMISLDGLNETHDQQRPFASGRGSSAVVTQAVDLALEHGLVPDISITVSGRNVDGLPELMAWVLEHDLPFSLNFYRENNFSKSHVDLKLEEEKIIAGMLTVYKVIEANLPSRSLLASLVDLANLSAPHLHTCNVGHSYLVFDYQGRVAKCQMQLDKPVTTADVHDPLALIRADQIGIQNISVEEKEGCRSCEWKYWCTGGCSLSTYRATGRYDIKSPNCNIYKVLYPEAIRLEGLRLLKYKDEQSDKVTTFL